MTRFQRIRQLAVPLPSGLKERLRNQPLVRGVWTAYRERQVTEHYRAMREHYAAIAAERKLVYSADASAAMARARMKARGYTPVLRKNGDVHTFAYVSSVSWHDHLMPDLRELGPVTRFDYESLGYRYSDLSRSYELLMEMSSRVLPELRAAHEKRPVDWVLFYGGGQDIAPTLVREITETLGIPVVNMSFDDKQGFAGASVSPWRTGAIDLTPHFDLYMTSARVCCDWHLAEGGVPVYLPEGFDASSFAPRDMAKDIAVSFVGVAYGFRIAIAKHLRDSGVPFEAWGRGWPSGHASDPVETFNRSVINLGMGGIEYSEELTNVKGRDFEIPGTGGGAYLTSFNSDLAQHFVVGEEILCYRNRDEMLELIRYYLRRPDEAAEIARRGRARSLREHRWLHRFQTLLRMLGAIE